MEAAVVARGRTYRHPGPGEGTNELAEWRALLFALDIAIMLGERDVLALGDARHVIDRANGIARTRDPSSQACLAQLRERAPSFVRLRISYIRRSQNLAGIALERTRR